MAWPAGNSGVCTFFAPQSGVNGSLSIHVVNGTTAEQALLPIYEPSVSGNPGVGVSFVLEFNASATLTVPILGSIRTIRDFTEGPSLLEQVIQDAIQFTQSSNGTVTLSRIWLDNVTETQLSFSPFSFTDGTSITLTNDTVNFEAGSYNVSASFDYPQLTQLTAQKVLNADSQHLITQYPDQITALAFLSYTNKLLAGAWRFLTYFGRDSMISLLLLQPVLSEGQGGAKEAVISAVLERINRTDGSVCHEETLGDYATYLNLENNISSSAPSCTYQMIDTDYYLSIVMNEYFVRTAVGQSRMASFFSTKATFLQPNVGLTYAELALYNAEKIMNMSAPFAATGGQTIDNLIHIKPDQIVGEWRDSTYGIGGGKIPYDVNSALVPAALLAIASLSEAGFYPEHPKWATEAAAYAHIWQSSAPAFFEITVPELDARSLVAAYAKDSSGYSITSHISNITSDIVYHGLSLQGNNDQPLIKVMNTDDCFRLFLLNTTDQVQLSSFIAQVSQHILSPFPVGLSTPLGLVVANPAYGGDAVYAANWTNNAYHGTVIWSWPLAMMAAGLERQLGRCNDSSEAPAFCSNVSVYGNAKAAYNHLWDLIEANEANLSTEVWSWRYVDDDLVFAQFGALAPPPGQSPTESDIRQLWSLTFLAVTRDESLG